MKSGSETITKLNNGNEIMEIQLLNSPKEFDAKKYLDNLQKAH